MIQQHDMRLNNSTICDRAGAVTKGLFIILAVTCPRCTNPVIPTSQPGVCTVKENKQQLQHSWWPNGPAGREPEITHCIAMSVVIQYIALCTLRYSTVLVCMLRYSTSPLWLRYSTSLLLLRYSTPALLLRSSRPPLLLRNFFFLLLCWDTVHHQACCL